MRLLTRRLPRELLHNMGRYLGIFLLMVVAIGFTTGFLVASANIRELTGARRENYNVEDFRFTLDAEPPEAALDAVEDLGATVYENPSVDAETTVAGAGEDGADRNATVRVYPHRTEVDIATYDEGTAPRSDDELALDRTFAAHNGLTVGDELELSGKTFRITGIMTLPDYESLFESNTDFVMNGLTFGVAEATDAGYERLIGADGARETLTYSVVLNDRDLSQADRAEVESDAVHALAEHGAQVSDILDYEANQGISYAANDIEGDSTIWYVLLMLIIAIMGFVFAVLTGSTIDAESAIIGTLLASGYRRRELLLHYLALPVIVGLAGAVLGNILGYTVLSDPMCGLYYNSYSLPTYVSRFQPGVLLQTSVPPVVLLVVITFIGLVLRLRATPLQFLRSEKPGRRQRAHGIGLPEVWPFRTRFHLRVILRNAPHFLVLFLGVAFATTILMFGLCIMPAIEDYAAGMKDALVAEHLYTVKGPVEVEDADEAGAERFCAGALELSRAMGDQNEELTVYGIEPDSAYWTDVEVPDAGGADGTHGTTADAPDGADASVVLGAGAAAKCNVAAGDTVSFYDRATDKTYDLHIEAVTGAAACMDVYLSRAAFNELFDRDEGYFNGYASDEELDIPDDALVADLTPAAMDKIVAQMSDSMGDMMDLLFALAVAIYLILVYLLTKTVIDRSARSIAYLKVFGFRSGEVNWLYLWPITAVVLVSLVGCLPLVLAGLGQMFYVAFMDIPGYFTLNVPAWALATEVGVGAATYAVVAVLHVRHIRRVDMSEALKVAE